MTILLWRRGGDPAGPSALGTTTKAGERSPASTTSDVRGTTPGISKTAYFAPRPTSNATAVESRHARNPLPSPQTSHRPPGPFPAANLARSCSAPGLDPDSLLSELLVVSKTVSSDRKAAGDWVIPGRNFGPSREDWLHVCPTPRPPRRVLFPGWKMESSESHRGRRATPPWGTP